MRVANKKFGKLISVYRPFWDFYAFLGNVFLLDGIWRGCRMELFGSCCGNVEQDLRYHIAFLNQAMVLGEQIHNLDISTATF